MAAKPIIFLVAGQEQAARGAVRRSVRVGLQRSGAEPMRVAATPGRDIVALHIANGPTLLLHPENARDLMLAQGGAKRGPTRGSSGARPTRGSSGARRAAAPGEVAVPSRLQWTGLEEAAAARGMTRGLLGEVIVSAVEVIAGSATGSAADLAASKVVERVDAQVDPGVYRLVPDDLPVLKEGGSKVEKIAAAAGGAPLLVLVHGTFSNTSGTFRKLWAGHPTLVRRLFDFYGAQVYGLEHPTLGASPIANALALARALPERAKLHLLTHSRGGLVAEVLARVCAKPDLAKADLAAFAAKGYERQLADLKALASAVRKKGIQVERMVRVACPARGTLLASKRLDAYVSVFKWALELANVPVAPALVEFLGEVAQRRSDPGRIPGLAAQIPDSPLIQWLHAIEAPLPGDLRVVAGDIQGDSVVSWVKTLLADAYYWTDNDLVVQTSSMYGGGARAAGATFVLDQGGAVSHFNYFGNEGTAEAIVDALVKAQPAGFRAIGPLSWAGKSGTGVRARGDDGKPANEKPAVFVLPGILGSNLKVGDARIWLSWRLVNGLKRLDYRPASDRVEPDGPVERVYDDLARFLARSHEVFEFGYDWRKPLEDEARRLAREVKAALAARKQSGQPVRILAHSMGGLLARTMQLEEPAVWKQMMSVDGARMLMLGTPNAGSWAPMQVLSGDDTFGNALVAVGAPFQDHAARRMMARFPGFIQLQAALQDAALGLHDAAAWQRLADEDLARVRERNWWHDEAIQLNEYTWGVPTQGVLDQAVALRGRLDKQAQQGFGEFTGKMLLVVGNAAKTPDGYEMGPDGLAYLDARDHGDGRVTLASARLENVRTWKLDCEHGSLPSEKAAFEAYVELLDKGDTQLLDGLRSRGKEAAAVEEAQAPTTHVRSRPSRTPSSRKPPVTQDDVLSIGAREDAAAQGASPGAALRVTVANGNLMFVGGPLMLGHYRSTRLTGTERVMDALVGGSMNDALMAGKYPVAPGAQDVFIATRAEGQKSRALPPHAGLPGGPPHAGLPGGPPHAGLPGGPRPEAVVIVGLGEEGKLRGSELVHTVRQGTIEWAQREREKPDARATFELAATLIGSGGSGVSPAQSAQLVAQGVREANDHLDRIGWPRVDHLTLIELYLDRAAEALRALQVQAEANPGSYRVADAIGPGTGGLRRPLDQGYRGAEYDFITAKSLTDETGNPLIQYTLDTRRARTEVRGQMAQGRLVKALVGKASNDSNTDPRIARTLFQLLVPVEMDPFLGGATEMVIELDRGTAAIPWELLDTRASGDPDREPWAIRAKLVRKLRTADFRRQVVDANADSGILVIGEPRCDPEIYPRLPGARAEARAVYGELTAPGGVPGEMVKALIGSDEPDEFGPDERSVANALLGSEWRIVHIAGHGEPPERIGPEPRKSGDPPQADGDPRGVVLSDNMFLGPREIEAMRVVPELVFVNCCYLAASNPGQVLAQEQWRLGRAFNRPQFASTVAEKLIDIGVRCVVAAGWAVDDAAAKTFATTFYAALMRGQRFMDAVAEARKRAREKGGNTWAAYQCYGDPDWYLALPGVSRESRAKPPAERFSGVTSPWALTLALETLAMALRHPRPQTAAQRAAQLEGHRADLRFLEDRFAPRWGGMGFVAEAFGTAWAEAGEAARAKRWNRKAVKASDGSASLRTAQALKP